jgi:hypothetical protein
MEKIITGCWHCPFLVKNGDLGWAYLFWCKHPANYPEKRLESHYSYEPDGEIPVPVDPDWCPLKKEPITITLKLE